MGWLVPFLLLGVIGQTPVPDPVAGQPIAFAADHPGTCAPSTLTNCKVTYQLYVNGTKIGAEVPISSTPGVVWVKIAGLSAGKHTANMTAIARGTDSAGKAVTVESTPSTGLAFTVLAAPTPTPTVNAPSKLRLEWPTEPPPPPPPPPPDPTAPVVETHTTWTAATTVGTTSQTKVSIPAVAVGRTVLVTVMQSASTPVTYTVQSATGPATQIGRAVRSATDHRGTTVWSLGPVTTAGPVTVTVSTNIVMGSFRTSLLMINGTIFGDVWTQVEPADVLDHTCGAADWTAEDVTLCAVHSVSGSVSSWAPVNAEWVSPRWANGGWLQQQGATDGRIRVATGNLRRLAMIGIRVR